MDPSVEFGLKFESPEDRDGEPPEPDDSDDDDEDEGEKKDAEIVSLDSFRK